MAEYIRLDEACEINMGQSPDSNSYNENGEGLPFFQGNADFGEVYPKTRVWCNSPTKIVEPETLLISVRAPIGALNFAKEKSCIGRGLAGISAKDNFKSKYIYYCLKSKNTELNDKGTGSTFKAIAKNSLGETLVRKIPLPEQDHIIGILDNIQSIIDNRKKEISELDTLIKARFVEMFGDPVINNREMPIALIGDNCFVTKLAGFEYSQYIHYSNSGDVVMVKAQNVKNGVLNDKDSSYISQEVSDLLPRSQLLPGDVVMTYVGANIGDVAVIDDKHKYHLAPNVALIRPNNAMYNSIFLTYMLLYVNVYITSNSADTAKAALSMQRIRNLRVMVPPLELQQQFATFVTHVTKSKSAIQKSLDETQLLCDSLMQKYFG